MRALAQVNCRRCRTARQRVRQRTRIRRGRIRRLHGRQRRVLRRARSPRRQRVAQRLRTIGDRLVQVAGVVICLVFKRAGRAHHRLLRVLERIHTLLQLAVLVRQLGDVAHVAQSLTRMLVERPEALRNLLAERRNARRDVLPVVHADGKVRSRPTGRVHVACGDNGPCALKSARGAEDASCPLRAPHAFKRNTCFYTGARPCCGARSHAPDTLSLPPFIHAVAPSHAHLAHLHQRAHSYPTFRVYLLYTNAIL